MWFVLALSAALCWGLSYALSERILKGDISMPVYMMITSIMGITISLILLLTSPRTKDSISYLVNNPSSLAGPFFTGLLYSLGTVLVYSAIQRHNATSVGFVEISYPLFTALFAFALFGNVQLNLPMLAGAALIIAGLALISFYA